MIKRSRYKGSLERWALDENKHVSYELEFKGQIIKVGTQLKLKNDHTTYNFLCLVHDIKLDKTWMELSGPTGFYSKTVDRISKIVGIKRSYAKKAANVD